MSDIQAAIDRFGELAASGLEALIEQHAEQDDDAIALVLGIAAQRLRPEFGDSVADVAWNAVATWRDAVRGE